MIIGDGDRIVFTGDSVTDAGRGRPVGEGLHAGVGTGYVRQIENLLNGDFVPIKHVAVLYHIRKLWNIVVHD